MATKSEIYLEKLYKKIHQENYFEKNEIVKLTIEIPKSVHRMLKSKAALLGISMKDFLAELIDKENNDGASK